MENVFTKMTNQSKESLSVCKNCLCCMNKDFYPFCWEKNRTVKLTGSCKAYEAG